MTPAPATPPLPPATSGSAAASPGRSPALSLKPPSFYPRLPSRIQVPKVFPSLSPTRIVFTGTPFPPLNLTSAQKAGQATISAAIATTVSVYYG